MNDNQKPDSEQELAVTKALLEITKNKLFTAISTITELELVISIERDKNKQLTDLLENKDTGN